jgi:predicted O-methyltransferase YrrM
MEDLKYIQEPQALPEILAETAKLDFTMASGPRTGALLQALAASKSAGRLLELGTGTGVATSWLLSGMDQKSKLISVDVNEEFQGVARRTLGSDPRVTFITQDAAAFLWRQLPATYDLVFADSMPGKYEALDEALAVVKPGGFYVIDDMLPQANWPEGHEKKVPALLSELAANTEFHIVPITWASGLVIAVKKPAFQESR